MQFDNNSKMRGEELKEMRTKKKKKKLKEHCFIAMLFYALLDILSSCKKFTAVNQLHSNDQ